MTEQEKWDVTERYLRLVRANYTLLLKEERGRGGSALHRRQMNRLKRWLSAVETAREQLKRKEGKSSAKARRDWLVARTLEMTVIEQASDEELRMHLTGSRKLNRRFTDDMRREGIRAVKTVAEAFGLLD